MARNTVDFSEVEKLRDNLRKQLNQTQVDEFMESCAKELTARLLAKVIRRTPVGQYDHRVGGTLRRGWTSKTHEEAESGGNASASAYAKSLQIAKQGNMYTVEVVNPVEYASYVEFGHRTRNHRGWVKGQFMLTISEDELKRDAPKVLEKKLKKMLEGCFK